MPEALPDFEPFIHSCLRLCRRWFVRLFAIALLAIVGNAVAETILFTGATVHTVTGESIAPGQLLVKDGKIVGVGSSLPATDAKRVDLQGLHLFPGLIAATSSLGLTEISGVRATLDTTEVGAYTPDVQAWIAVNPDSELLPVARANGITHFLAVPMGGVVSGQSGLMTMSGWSVEEMAVKKPVALHLFWPSMSLDTTPRELLRDRSAWKSPEDQAKERQKRLRALDDFFAEARAYVTARESARPDGARETPLNPAWEAMRPWLRGETPLVVHADEVRQIKAALNWAGTRGFKIILAGGRDAWMVADQLASKQVPVIYDATFNLPARDTDSYDTNFKTPSLLHQAGVTVIFSEGVGARNATSVRNLPYAAAQAVAFGLPRAEALKGLTLYPAQLFGVADRLGSLEPGKDATFFTADGDILDLRASVKRMWIEGKEVALDSRHTRFYEKYKSRPKAP